MPAASSLQTKKDNYRLPQSVNAWEIQVKGGPQNRNERRAPQSKPRALCHRTKNLSGTVNPAVSEKITISDPREGDKVPKRKRVLLKGREGDQALRAKR